MKTAPKQISQRHEGHSVERTDIGLGTTIVTTGVRPGAGLLRASESLVPQSPAVLAPRLGQRAPYVAEFDESATAPVMVMPTSDRLGVAPRSPQDKAIAAIDDSVPAELMEDIRNIEIRIDDALRRDHVTIAEFRGLWSDLDAYLKGTVVFAQSRASGPASAAIGGADAGLPEFNETAAAILRQEAYRFGFVTPNVQYALGSVGSPLLNLPVVASVDLSEVFSWENLKDKILTALGLGGLDEIAEIWDDISALVSAIAEGVSDWKAAGKLGKKKAVERAKEKAKAKIKAALSKFKGAVLKKLKNAGGKLTKKLAQFLAKLGVPGWVAGVVALFLLLLLWNLIWA